MTATTGDALSHVPWRRLCPSNFHRLIASEKSQAAPASHGLLNRRSFRLLLHSRMSHTQNGIPLLYLWNLGHYLRAPYRGKR
jgi:hypothetical protein